MSVSLIVDLFSALQMWSIILIRIAHTIARLEKGTLCMSNGDSKEQQKQVKANKQLNKKVNGDDNQVIVDKKLDGPNRPAD